MSGATILVAAISVSTAPPVSAPPIANALREFEGALGCVCANLVAAIDGAVPYADIGDLTVEELDSEDSGGSDSNARIDMGALRGLLGALDGASNEIEGAFRDFDWEVARALRGLKRALKP
jgi:hypothetical protein